MPFTTLFLILSLIVTPAALQSQSGDALWEAARKGDLARVRELVESGVDVNTRTRYGATALSFASDKGHLELVAYLIEQGADVNAQDTFYKATPLSWAVSNGHSDVAQLLLKKGAKGAGQALQAGVGRKDLELVRTAIETGQVDARSLTSALKSAREADSPEIVAMLEAAGAVTDQTRPEVKVDPAILKGYAGDYRNEEIGMSLNVSFKDGQLYAQASGQPALTLKALSEQSFRAVEAEGMEISFSGRAGMVEQVVVNVGDRPLVFLPAASREDTKATVEAQKVDDTALRPAAPAGKPINWPSFRGAGASGVGDGQEIPVKWDVESGQNVKWKTSLPGIANSSPVVWGDRVFVTTAVSGAGDESFRTGLYGDVKPLEDLSEHSWHLYSVDRMTGKIVWERKIYEGVPLVKRHPKASQANSTPAVDGSHVVVLFGSIGGLYCYDLEGNLLWKKDLGALNSGWFYDPDYQWGHSSSPIIYKNLVIVQADIDKNSFIAAWDLDSGKEMWRTPREEIPTWGTPTVYSGQGRDELVTNGTTIRGYDPATGKLLWQLAPNSEVTVATPVAGPDLIYVTAGYPPVRPIYAVRPGGNGDISLEEGKQSNASIAWSHDKGGTYIPTPILYGEYFYTCANNGVVTCYKADNGEKVYQARLGGQGGSYLASPVASDGKLYFISETGEVYVVRAGPKYEELASNDMKDVCAATPAISKKLLIVRTIHHLYGIGSE